MEMAVVGNEEFVLGFKLVGVRKAFVADRGTLESRISEMLEDKNVGILVLNQEDVPKLSLSMKRRLEESSRPVVIFVGRTEEEDLRAKVRRAIGVDLYKTA